MRVMVAMEDRFSKTRNGNIYSSMNYDYNFWSRYLEIFDEVVVLARVVDVELDELNKLRADGPNVSFICLPAFIGPWQYLKFRHRINRIVKEALSNTDAYILRIPSIVGTVLWKNLIKQKKPYGVEVVGDPWDSLARGSVKSIVRPLVRLKMRWDQWRQCRYALSASYVTEYSLQKRYPPGQWSTYSSDVALSPQLILTDKLVEERIKIISRKHDLKGPWRICYAGTMAQLYKAPDVLINAVAKCIAGGLNLELVMLGDGQYRNQLQEQAKKLGIGEKVKFLGMLLPGQAVYDQFDQADLYVLPSRQEGLPRAMIEAMARGLPCIGSNVGGFCELLQPKHMVKPGNVKALSNKITEVISDADGMKKAVKRNVRVANRYCSTDLQRNRIEFYTKVKEAALGFLSRNSE